MLRFLVAVALAIAVTTCIRSSADELTPGEVWWTRDDHFAYFIKLRGELGGFALLRTGSRVTSASDVMDVAEFFVLRGLRGKGIGRSAAHALFGAFPGGWEVRVRRTNVAALQFLLQGRRELGAAAGVEQRVLCRRQ